MNTNKQKQIMAKALEIIGNEGMGKLTISHLSHNIGVSDGALYRHFDSKLSIIKEILNELFYHVSEQMVEEVRKDKPVKIKLQHIITKLYQLFEEKPGYVSLLFSEEYFFSDAEIFYLMQTIITTMQMYLRQMLEQGIENRELKSSMDSTHMALLIMGAMRITVLNWRLQRNNETLGKNGESLMNSVIELLES